MAEEPPRGAKRSADAPGDEERAREPVDVEDLAAPTGAPATEAVITGGSSASAGYLSVAALEMVLDEELTESNIKPSSWNWSRTR